VPQWKLAMVDLTIPPLDQDDIERLRLRAMRNARTVGEEARDILHAALAAEQSAIPEKFGTAIHLRFKSVGGIDLPDMPRNSFPSDPFAQG
jgi:antitoxin FitA